MYALRTLFVFPIALALSTGIHAQNTLKDGTTLTWDKQITVVKEPLMVDSAALPAFTIAVYEAKASEVQSMLKKEMAGADFKKQGKILKAAGANFPAASAAPVDILGKITENKKQKMSTLTLAFVSPGSSTQVENPDIEAAMRDLSVRMNKAVVQKQLDTWTKKLGKADSKAKSAEKSRDKAQSKLNKAQSQLEKSSRERSKLQSEHVIMQKEIDLYNEKWTLSQNAKDFKKLTKTRSKITKNEAKMAKLMKTEAKAQKELTKASSNLPDEQKAKEEKVAVQTDVQRTVDSLQRKLESIR